MPEFGYKALSPTGVRRKGWAQASTAQELREMLQAQGLTLLSHWRSGFFGKVGRKSVTPQEREDLFVHLAALGGAGFPLEACFESVPHQGVLGWVCHDIATRLRAGQDLVSALTPFGNIFDRTCLCVLGAAQKKGDFAPAFEHLGGHYAWRKQVEREVQKALVYPLCLLFLVAILLTFLMSEVVPQLESFLTMTGANPSWSATLLKGVCTHLGTVVGVGALSLILLVTGIFVSSRLSPKRALFWERVLRRVPVLGPLWHNTQVQRFTQSLALMMGAGVPLLEGLAAAALPRRAAFRREIDQVIQNIKGGDSLAQALGRTGLFPPTLLQLCALGEKTGRLETFLTRAAHLLEQDCKRRTQRQLAILEPACLMVVGGLLIWIVMAIFVPLYEHIAVLEG